MADHMLSAEPYISILSTLIHNTVVNFSKMELNGNILLW